MTRTCVIGRLRYGAANIFLLQLLLGLSIFLGPNRPLFEGPLWVPRLAADSSAEFILTGLRAECRPDIAILLWQRMKGASSLTVSLCMRVLSAAVDSAPPLLARRHASEGQAACGPLLFVGPFEKWTAHARPTSSHERCASPCPARWQGASFWWRVRIQRARGGTRVAWHVPLSMPSTLARCGVIWGGARLVCQG